jgi:hypothetical protein
MPARFVSSKPSFREKAEVKRKENLLIWDRLREMADANAGQSFSRIQQNARRDYGQEFWWKPGDSKSL